MPPAPGGFAPFDDRLSRDLRNRLSEGLLAALAAGNSAPLTGVAEEFHRRPDLSAALANYLTERLACYRAVLAQADHGNPDRLALLLWDHELFFEFHELLEKRWLVAAGAEKMMLQGLIRAAGTFVHRQQGRVAGAAKMAARARETIAKYREILPPGFDAEKILPALADPQAPPPRLAALPDTTWPCRHLAGGSANS